MAMILLFYTFFFNILNHKSVLYSVLGNGMELYKNPNGTLT